MFKSILSYTGSKWNSLEHILPSIPVDTEIYLEPFCGSCSTAIALLQTRPNHFKQIVCSDINADLILFWNYIKDHVDSFNSELINFMDSYSDLELQSLVPSTDLEKILRFYYAITCSYMNSESKYILDSRVSRMRQGVCSPDNFKAVSEIIAPVTFKNASYDVAINEAVTTGLKTFCFADPPYRDLSLKQNGWYIENFIDLSDLHDKLDKCDNFVLSYCADELLDIIFSDFTIKHTVTRLSGRPEIYVYK